MSFLGHGSLALCWSLGLGHCSFRPAPHSFGELLDLPVVVPPGRVHVTDDALARLRRRRQPVLRLAEAGVVVVGRDDLAVAAAGEELEALVPLAVIPVH